MRVLLDVGGHVGETLLEVISPAYALDKIYCFEPAENCWGEIEKIADPRIELCKFGLWKETTKKVLYGAGEAGASIFADAEAIDRRGVTETIELVRAADWVAAHTSPGDVVFMKLNCEGSECDIVEDLLDAGLLGNLYSVMIDFDVRKIPSLRWREVAVRKRLREAGLTNVCFTEDVMRGELHQERTRGWMQAVGGEDKLPLAELRSRHAARLRELSSRSGSFMRFEGALRRAVFARLPVPLKNVARRVWAPVRHAFLA